MRKICVLLVFLLPLVGFSQFTLTPHGLVNTTDTTRDYLVLSFPGKTAAELYNQVLLYLNKTYMSPKDVISKIENQSITVSGYAPRAISRNDFLVFDMNYSINMEFKDGRIKVAAPGFTFTAFNSKPQTLHLVADGDLGSTYGVWNTRLKLKSDMAKRDIETFFNHYVAQLKGALSAGSDW